MPEIFEKAYAEAFTFNHTDHVKFFTETPYKISTSFGLNVLHMQSINFVLTLVPDPTCC